MEGCFNAWLPRFHVLLLADICTQIDRSKRPRFRDKELACIGLAADPNDMVADKLVEVGLRDGRKSLVLIHVKIQAQQDTSLPQRILDYNDRISSGYGLPVASLALLADEGLERDRKEVAQAILERQLAKRFRPLSKTAQNKLIRVSSATLEAWGEALLGAKSLRQLFESCAND